MRHYLVVANRTLRSEQLHELLRQLAAEQPSSFHLVVPSTHPHGAWAEGTVHRDASLRLADALQRFSDLGAPVDGEVVDDASPVRAVGDVLLRQPGHFDAIVLSTKPPGISRWMKFDSISRMRSHRLPVIHVVEAREHATA
jgi:hypothetical protein